MRCDARIMRAGRGCRGQNAGYIVDSVWVVTLVSFSICLFILIFRVVTSSISTCTVVNARGKAQGKVPRVFTDLGLERCRGFGVKGTIYYNRTQVPGPRTRRFVL